MSGMAAPDHLILLLAAMGLDVYLGESAIGRLAWRPAALLARLVDGLDRKLNRPLRGARVRAARGAVTVAAVMAVAVAVGVAIDIVARGGALLWLVELALVTSLIDVRGPYNRVTELMEALENEGLDGGRAALAAVSDRDPMLADAPEIARLGIEALATDTARAVAGPLLAYGIFGLAGLLGYRAAMVLAARLGRRGPDHAAFGGTALALAHFIGWAPAWLGALGICLGAAMVRGARPGAALRVALRDSWRHAEPGSGWPLAAMAGALDVALAGPRRYGQDMVARAWLGGGAEPAGPAQMRRALALYTSVSLTAVASIAAAAAWRWFA